MFAWIWQGLRTGILTTRYPKTAATMPAAYRGHLVIDPERCSPTACTACAEACLPRAITVTDGVVRLDLGRCIGCGLCVEACPNGALALRPDVELAVRMRPDLITEVIDPRANGDGRRSQGGWTGA